MQSPLQDMIKFNPKMYQVIIHHDTMTKCDVFQVCQAGSTFKNQSISITVLTGWRKKSNNYINWCRKLQNQPCLV